MLQPHDTKQCSRCGAVKLIINMATKQPNFDRDKTKPDGYRSDCRECRRHTEETDYNRQMSEQVQMLDMATLNLLQNISKSDRYIPSSLPHLATLLEDLMTVCGGSKNLAQHLWGEFLAAKPGSMIRAKYITSITNLIKFASEQNYVAPPLETMSDEDLEHYYEQRRKDARLKLGIVDADGRVQQSRSSSAS